MKPDFYRKHFSDLCCYEDYLMTVDLMGLKHNDPKLLSILPKCNGHKFVIAGGEIIWIDDNGEKVDNPIGTGNIDKYAFLGCVELTSIVIPEGVTRIGDYAFYGCSSLKSMIIPEGVTNIGESAFYQCKGLTSVTIPNSVKNIGSYAFDICDNLKSVKVPKGCKIRKSAFPYGCTVIRY